jgi:leucyl aminopeptidase
MKELLPPSADLRLSQGPTKITRAELARLDQAVIVLPAKPADADWRGVPGGAQLRAASRRAGAGTAVHSRLANPRGTGLSAQALPGGELDSFRLLQFAGKLVAEALATQPRSLAFILSRLDGESAERLAEALVLAAYAQNFALPTAQTKAKAKANLKSIKIFGVKQPLELPPIAIAARAQNLARWLTSLPPNRLNASGYRELAKQLAKEYGWQMQFLDEKKLAREKAGAFLAVSQGNAARDAGIIHLRYEPKKASKQKPLALVGKGIVFDTGGNNLKPHKSMLDMHEDMAGSAVALATLQALTELDYPRTVDCWLAVTENRISATAYLPRDVITASNGITIEIIHTDAEGRLVLADTLAIAGRQEPELIIDYATLTGACVYSLTERYSGVFTNRDSFNEALVAAGRRSGERVWPFPMDRDFDEALKSKAADILQCSTDGSGDHILAARFLQRFVPKGSDWVHMDLSSASRKEGLGQVPGGATGFGVRLTLEFLQAHK